MATGPEHGLKWIVWQRIKNSILEDCKKPGIWKVLILDQFTTQLLSSCCKMSDLMSEGITIVEDLFKIREPVPEMKAIYFITPTAESVEAFIKDWKPKAKYKAAYIYFTDCCPDELFSKIKMDCARHIRVCKEINISFLPQESQVFTCDNPGAFRSIYSPHSEDRLKTLETLANQIVTLCATLNENPGIRYKKDSSVQYAKQLAEMVDRKLEEHYKVDGSAKKDKTQSQLLIVDRGFDPVSPVLHELTYQAMAYDLLPIEKDTYKYKHKDGTVKEALLNESDELWGRLRHMHIAQVTEKIPKLVKEISASKKTPDSKISIGSLANLMKKMPSVRKQLAQKTVHVNLAEDCMSHWENGKIEKLCQVEQDLAVGMDLEGQKVKDPMRTLLPVLLPPKDRYTKHNKIRAVLLYIFSLNGTTEENLNKLIEHVEITNERDYILNWKELGVPIIASMSLFRRTARREREEQEDRYSTSRWTPVIKDVMEDAVVNKLDWPHVSGAPTVWNGSRAVSARQKHKGSADDHHGSSKLIIFILGGVSYSEMRCAYEVTQATKSCEVFIGSSHILTPDGLLNDIQRLTTAVSIEKFTIENERTS
ncbi:syntaxin-binding protein 3 [Clupea harengus]|uniref:Syntaxin-binding protein 3 n=1 Tax=Clupea harengus TaxID=7950 RepID=A0A6P3WC73_CLUHA|nr:syntaxin-binding protein 3 [Clupea harengus]